jgi:hypothetical protein
MGSLLNLTPEARGHTVMMTRVQTLGKRNGSSKRGMDHTNGGRFF